MKRGLAIVLAFAMLSTAQPVVAADAGGTLAERYDRARRTLDQQRAEEATALQNRDRLAGEAATLRTQLVANAARVQELEAALAATQDEIAALSAREAELAAAFARDRERVARLLAIMQRLDADEPPALVVRSDDSLAAARGTMLLGSLLPPVYEQAAILGRQLRVLNETRAGVQAKNAEAREEAAALGLARRALSELLDQRSREARTTEVQLVELRALTEESARTTGDLESLLGRIAALRAQDRPQDSIVVVTPGGASGPGPESGALVRPVVGQALPGDPAGPGTTAGIAAPPGLWFEASGAAQAVAPADAEVIFAGAYQKFGEVLILELPGGYHLVLAGFGRIDVRIGDLVLAGEPVGILPEGGAARLYLELRRNGRAVDAVPWLGAELRKASRG